MIISYRDHTVWYGRGGTFLLWDLKSISVNNKVFLVGWLTSVNITVIRGETLPDLTMRSWYDICQPLVLVISFSLPWLCWIFHAVDFFDLEPLMVDYKYNIIMFSVAVRVSSWHLFDGFVRQFLCVDGAAAFLVCGSEMPHVTVCAPLGRIMLSICSCEADNHRHAQI